MPSTDYGECSACGYEGYGWIYGGPQIGLDRKTAAFHYWNCPKCRSHKSSPSATFPPLVYDRVHQPATSAS